MIDACRSLEIEMISAKMFIRVLADGYDKDDHTPLVRIKKGKPQMQIDRVKPSKAQRGKAKFSKAG
jgi:hypothetical protein